MCEGTFRGGVACGRAQARPRVSHVGCHSAARGVGCGGGDWKPLISLTIPVPQGQPVPGGVGAPHVHRAAVPAGNRGLGWMGG